MRVYKIFTEAEWDTFEATGQFAGSQADRRDGFIHLSSAQQAAQTADKHFPQYHRLWLAAINTGAMEPHLRWEPSRGGDLFPHFYGIIHLALIEEHWLIERDASGSWQWPEFIKG